MINNSNPIEFERNEAIERAKIAETKLDQFCEQINNTMQKIGEALQNSGLNESMIKEL